MERFLLGDLLVLRDLDHDAAADGEGVPSVPLMAGVPLRSLASFSLGGHTCRSGLADAPGTAVAASRLPQPVVLEVSGCPVSIWRLPEWHVGDWTVVHLVLPRRCRGAARRPSRLARTAAGRARWEALAVRRQWFVRWRAHRAGHGRAAGETVGRRGVLAAAHASWGAVGAGASVSTGGSSTVPVRGSAPECGAPGDRVVHIERRDPLSIEHMFDSMSHGLGHPRDTRRH